MRWIALLALVALGSSSYLAPRHYAARTAVPPAETRFFDPDPRIRVALGEKEGMLGVQLLAWEDRWNAHPGDLEALRGRFRLGLKIGAVALSQPRIQELVMEEVRDYLKYRAELDPDGALLQEVLADWIALRLDHPYFHASASVAIYLAARGDQRGFDKILQFTRTGRFYGEFFRYARRFHPPWEVTGFVIRHYLEQGDLNGRVQAGATLLEYNGLFGLGEDLLRQYLALIRDALHEAAANLEADPADAEVLSRGEACLIGLALLDGPEERAILERLREEDVPRYVTTLRMVRVWVGLEPWEKYAVGSERWQLMDEGGRELYFAGAAHAYARLAKSQRPIDAARREEMLGILLDGLKAPAEYSRIQALQALVALSPEHRQSLPRRIAQGGGVESFFAALMLGEDVDKVPFLLPALTLTVPHYPALAAVYLSKLPPK